MNSKLFDRFDCLDLCLHLIDVNRMHEVKQLLNEVEPLRQPLVKRLSNAKHHKNATKIVLDYGLDPELFPELLYIVEKNSSIFFIRRVFKDEEHADYMPLYKVEDLLQGHPRMLGFLAEELYKYSQKQHDDYTSELWSNRAKGVQLRNNLPDHVIKENIREALDQIEYEERQGPEDVFGPVTENCLALPASVQTQFIDTEEACEQLRDLIGKPVIGLDAEWRPNLTKFIKT